MSVQHAWRRPGLALLYAGAFTLGACAEDERSRPMFGAKDTGVASPDSGVLERMDSGDEPTPDADVTPEEDGGLVEDAGMVIPDSGMVRPDGGGGSAGRLPTGSVSFQSSNNCPNSQVPRSGCFRATVSCDGVPSHPVILKISEPQGPVRGTVVLGTGGPGTALYEQFAGGTYPINNLLLPLYMMGYRVVQRAWEPPGWNGGPGGPMRVGCRLASVYEALRDMFPNEPFCASGQSGGSAELGYALAHYGAENILDAAVFSGGPPLGRLDHGCLGHNDPAWQSECERLSTCGGTSCTFTSWAPDFVDAMYADGSRYCAGRMQSARATLLQDSILNPLADLDHPQTEVRFVFGQQDCSEAAPLGRIYAEAITSSKQISFVPGVSHIVPEFSEGADAILLNILESCTARH